MNRTTSKFWIVKGRKGKLAYLSLLDSGHESRMATGKSWAGGECEEFTYDNKPVGGIRVSGWASRYSTSNKFVELEDPRGFILQVSVEKFYELMQNVTIVKGVIEEALIWGKCGNDIILGDISDFSCDTRYCKITDLKVGQVFRVSKCKTDLIYLGKKKLRGSADIVDLTSCGISTIRSISEDEGRKFTVGNVSTDIDVYLSVSKDGEYSETTKFGRVVAKDEFIDNAELPKPKRYSTNINSKLRAVVSKKYGQRVIPELHYGEWRVYSREANVNGRVLGLCEVFLEYIYIYMSEVQSKQKSSQGGGGSMIKMAEEIWVVSPDNGGTSYISPMDDGHYSRKSTGLGRIKNGGWSELVYKNTPISGIKLIKGLEKYNRYANITTVVDPRGFSCDVYVADLFNFIVDRGIIVENGTIKTPVIWAWYDGGVLLALEEDCVKFSIDTFKKMTKLKVGQKFAPKGETEERIYLGSKKLKVTYGLVDLKEASRIAEEYADNRYSIDSRKLVDKVKSTVEVTKSVAVSISNSGEVVYGGFTRVIEGEMVNYSDLGAFGTTPHYFIKEAQDKVGEGLGEVEGRLRWFNRGRYTTGIIEIEKEYI